MFRERERASPGMLDELPGLYVEANLSQTILTEVIWPNLQ